MELLRGVLYKKQTIFLISVISMFIVWKFGIDKTFEAWILSRELSLQIKEADGMAQKVASIKSYMLTLDSKFMENKIRHESFQNLLLDEISEYCKDHEIIVTLFPETHYFNDKEFVIQTVNFTSAGSFEDLLGLAFYLEQQKRIGRVASVEFQNTKNNKSDKMDLKLTMYIQLVTKTKPDAQ